MTVRNLVPKNAPRVMKLVSLSLVGVAASLFILSLGCGSGSSTSHSLSAAQAQAVSQEFSTALQSALSQSLGQAEAARQGSVPSLASTLGKVRPQGTSGCTVSGNGESCNIPVNYSGSCPGGGTIAVSGDFSFTLDSSGDGSVISGLTVTPTDCSVSNETINGNPSVTASTQITFTNDAPDFPITLNESGGISFGPNPSGSCTLNVQYTVSSETMCTVAGTICGQTVSGSC